MTPREDELVLLLARLVIPNWPHLKGTSISLLDARECALRGTEEQRKTAREARSVMEQVWELDPGSSVRRMLEGVCRPSLAEGVELDDASTEAEYVAAVEQEQGPRTLPLELLRRVLYFVIIDAEERPRDIDLSCFCRLRLVNHALRDIVETAFPNTLHRYASRVVRHLLHVEWQGHSVTLAQLAFASAPLFGRVKQLRLWLAGDDAGALNAVLPTFTRLQQLVICATSKETRLSGLELDLCPRLRSLHVAGLSLEDPSPDERLRRWFGDIHRDDRPLNTPLVQLNRTRPVLAPPSLVSLRIGRIFFERTNLFVPLQDLIRSHVARVDFRDAGAILRGAIVGLGLNATECPARLDFRGCQMLDDGVASLALGSKRDIQVLDLSRTGLVNPAVLQLSENRSIIRLNLSDNSLSSIALGLRGNGHLRSLDLSGALTALESISTALSELGDQLQDNTVLEELFLDRNGITNDAMLSLRLASGTTGLGLRWVSLALNNISDTGLRTMKPLLATLQRLDVTGNRYVTKQCALELSSETITVLQGPADTSWMHWKEEGRFD